jgi:hypothetical protein
MLKFLKMMVAEDVTTTEEVRAEALEEEVLEALEAKEVRRQEKAVLADLEVQLLGKVDLEVTEIQLQGKVDFLEVRHREEKVDLDRDHQMLQNAKVDLQVELQDDLKAQVIHQDQEDQEKNNNIC